MAIETTGARPKRGMRGDKKMPARMQQRLKADGAMAGTKKDPNALSIPMTTAARATQRRKGDMMRVI
jgi:hypothetical protein